MDTPDTYWNLFYGYAAFWGILAYLVVRLMGENAKTNRELTRLERELEQIERAQDERRPQERATKTANA